ncbi:MAG: NADH-quinone oxidoreductase subunit N [Ignavibacteriae bacterium]|nr:MAG: NADH-quinone oxidoreductase subunit N [Ignavibacteriota bacterium]
MHIDLFGSLPLVVIWLALGAIGIVIQAFVKNDSKLVFGYYLGTLALTGVLAAVTYGHHGTTFNGMITLGGTASFFDMLFCAAGIMTMLAARPYLHKNDTDLDEFYTMLVSAVAGMMLMAHATNLVVLFVGIELMSISFYIMAGFLRTRIRSIESALKYFLLGSFATGFLVYGMALLFGATGSLQYDEILKVVAEGTSPYPSLLAIGAVLLAVGLSFKIAAFPFHQWAPDVYEGAPTVVTAFMSTAGKAAAFSAFIPVFAALMPMVGATPMTGPMQNMLAGISAITMLIGNITAIAQTNVKRMLAYSSVAHAGYLLMGIVAGTSYGHSAIVFYVTAYTFMQLGAFVIVGILERDDETSLDLNDWAGLSKKHPIMAGVMAVFMFSLAGIPPFAGFFGKYMLFYAAVQSGYTWLTIVAVVSSVISVWFYLGLVVKMYFNDPQHDGYEAPAGLAGISLAVCTVAVVLLGVLPNLLTGLVGTW